EFGRDTGAGGGARRWSRRTLPRQECRYGERVNVHTISLDLPPAAIDAIARRVAELLRPALRPQPVQEPVATTLNQREAADFLHISIATLKAIDDLPVITIGRARRYSRDTLAAWIARRENAATNAPRRQAGLKMSRNGATSSLP